MVANVRPPCQHCKKRPRQGHSPQCYRCNERRRAGETVWCECGWERPLNAEACARCVAIDGAGPYQRETTFSEYEFVSALRVLGGTASAEAVRLELGACDRASTAGDRQFYRVLERLKTRGRVAVMYEDAIGWDEDATPILALVTR